ncbi:class I SAM-dependent methyltransferase [Pedobacter sp. SD-b]|uniref:Class I SAM-dependent methyltransferase n=1 Tax=Pedobacter segetis TaxID=2793069 RepID=A0ABS1BNL2_9SPHI|nr:class I SAM-dependent methyltransferase [Pedobacter segetis]MBK0384497.1 class I SAM-dependent methyltransferase [Pedobacter segetis]
MFNASLVVNYIKHLAKANTRHGIHSPFVYHLVDEVIYDFKEKPAYKNIENLRKKLLSDERFITITDLGAGSYVNNLKQKQVKQLAKNALKPKKLAQLLYRLAKEFQPRNIIELGTCLGITTAYLSEAVPEAKVITLEGCPQTAGLAQENFKSLGLKNVNTSIGNFDDTLPPIIEAEQSLDFIFIDGNHRKDATINYFNWFLPHVNKDSVIIFDDIYWSGGMQEAWEMIKEHPQVTVTIDLFWIGLVFFKKDQAKEHFKVKF